MMQTRVWQRKKTPSPLIGPINQETKFPGEEINVPTRKQLVDLIREDDSSLADFVETTDIILKEDLGKKMNVAELLVFVEYLIDNYLNRFKKVDRARIEGIFKNIICKLMSE